MVKQALMLAAFVAAAAVAADDQAELFKAYSERNFSKTRRLAAKDSNSPESRLIKALVLLHDKTDFQMIEGFKELKALQDAKFRDPALKLQADLAYARTAQLIDMRRDIYGDAAKGIDFNRIYNEIITGHPKSLEACFAIAYKLFPIIEEGSQEEGDKAFEELEDFIGNYQGPMVNLAPLHLFADDEYVGKRGDYKNGVRHLVAAYDIGITNPRIRQETLFRIGRYYDHRLKDKANAVKYYNEYIRLYPMSNRAPVVERLLKAMGEGAATAGKPAASAEETVKSEVK